MISKKNIHYKRNKKILRLVDRKKKQTQERRKKNKNKDSFLIETAYKLIIF